MTKRIIVTAKSFKNSENSSGRCFRHGDNSQFPLKSIMGLGEGCTRKDRRTSAIVFLTSSSPSSCLLKNSTEKKSKIFIAGDIVCPNNASARRCGCRNSQPVTAHSLTRKTHNNRFSSGSHPEQNGKSRRTRSEQSYSPHRQSKNGKTSSLIRNIFPCPTSSGKKSGNCFFTSTARASQACTTDSETPAYSLISLLP